MISFFELLQYTEVLVNIITLCYCVFHKNK